MSSLFTLTPPSADPASTRPDPANWLRHLSLGVFLDRYATTKRYIFILVLLGKLKMRSTFAVAIAALVAAASPAAACGVNFCLERAVSDDAYPPAQPQLPPSVQELVRIRQDGGLSLAGFYNDPSLALLEYAPQGYRRPHVVRSRY